jgi:fructose-bisphosphate aldolase / 2-amino-3,7-dideoxy-D-threo-hept-6-ulosonate synthase
MIGKKIRIERIINKKTGRTVIVPLDRSVSIDPVEGIRDMRETIDEMAIGGANAVIMHKGMVNNGYMGYGTDIGLIVHLSASTSLGPDPDYKVLVTSVAKAVKIGADAVSVHVNVGSNRESLMLETLGITAEACDE